MFCQKPKPINRRDALRKNWGWICHDEFRRHDRRLHRKG